MLTLLLAFIVGMHAGYTNWTTSARFIGAALIAAVTIGTSITASQNTLEAALLNAAIATAIHLVLAGVGYFCGRGLQRYNAKHHGGA